MNRINKLNVDTTNKGPEYESNSPQLSSASASPRYLKTGVIDDELKEELENECIIKFVTNMNRDKT